MKALVWAVAVWIAVFTFTPVTQAADFKTADMELNRVYKQVLQKYADEPVFINKFKKAQRAWLKFRDAHLESRYPAEDKRDYGSIYSLCSSNLLAELTQARTKQLKLWLEGIGEGDGCAGSVSRVGWAKSCQHFSFLFWVFMGFCPPLFNHYLPPPVPNPHSNLSRHFLARNPPGSVAFSGGCATLK